MGTSTINELDFKMNAINNPSDGTGKKAEFINALESFGNYFYKDGDYLDDYFRSYSIDHIADGKYVFETTSPTSTARVPMGTYVGEQYIDNDLYEIIKELKEY